MEGREGDESIAMGAVVMGLLRSGGESNDGEGTEVEVGKVLAFIFY